MENGLFQRLFRDAAPRQTRQDDPDLQRPGLVDEPEPEHPDAEFDSDTPRRYPIGPGLYEDSVAMPGGGQVPIDRLEDTGLMSNDLLRKARPEVWQYEEASRALPPGAPGLEDTDGTHLPNFESRARVYAGGGDWASHRGPAVDRYAHFLGDTEDMPSDDRAALRERLYARAAAEADRKGVFLPEDPRSNDPIRPIRTGTSDEDQERARRTRDRATH